MQRPRISLTRDDRQLLDDEAARTGRSISALIGDAVSSIYGKRRSTSNDLAVMAETFRSWGIAEIDGEGSVEQRRAGSRAEQL